MSYQLQILPVDLSCPLLPGQTVLDAALADGLMLKHSCRTGTCGSCKGQVLSGDVDHGDSSLEVLSAAERAQGLALFCCATARSDLVIEAPEVTALRGISIQQMGVRVASIDKVSSDVAVLRLMLAPGAGFDYFPGQYVQVLLKDGSRRSYSMATRSARDNQLELHIRHMPGGVFSGHVFNALQPKAILRMEGPFGSFYLRDSERPMIFLASGTGFAPIQALLEQLRESDNRRPVYLYWGGRRREDLYRHEQLLAWEAQLPWLRYTPVLSDPTPACDWQGATGFVHRQVLSDFQSLKGFEVYACGAPIVVDSARRDYVELRQLEAADFYADAFV
ncbi:CDP-6-deoxy-delta-3,4-glucoseen reductase [Pseudomonas extremaustralis]|jgi:CDP-4-dehydro-6-deoxyglucose reductase|uniref:CDP-4-dehydro-6-deoxyglucose reductase n=1 Tax=Pseudomonas extremaustralis TaxID=359110 RepID=A0A5C5Q5I7_9PSED|nr:CDP-6-deoxy-delta-3,4-glucoseen reductase [Pseudomonas extremaustralis]EZI24957.1 CDP-6-deoxy-delta-3,4-glucoseen reductase [Pseudomonas extremaustralis 14-3 substr. 14-3b]MDB1113792.1 CDP-6-deoxy-delta-3,4-glucoseen reductase [Pseudomonas extremaustralis]MDF3134271.1 CDP-6-deoxy-delta-3,4-glucoseen reductase [Pseudomonas extremaustralis]MDG2970733.1 CDP-6-deoxy-delta-3,4-glucoseen reductase [Pseudomonas extremaustralis]TWS00925.1 CDP-6-deoxy-delta-3,4-glucoseen reductase [Pseudomonas extre